MSMNKKILLFLVALLSLFSFRVVLAEEEVVDNNQIQQVRDETNEVPTIGAVTDTENSKYRLIIEDDAHLLSDSEIEQLKDKMMSLTKYGHIAFKSIDQNDMSASSFAASYYHEHFSSESGSLFLIDMDNRKIYIFSDGTNYQSINSSKANSITDNVFRYATDGNYYLCAYHAFDQMQTVLDGGKIAEPMRYTSILVISVVLSFFFNFLLVLSKSKIKSSSNQEIVKGCNIDFKLGDVHAEKTGTHRVYSPVSDSSSSGGGGGGGGGSSGGGGGHSF